MDAQGEVKPDPSPKNGQRRLRGRKSDGAQLESDRIDWIAAQDSILVPQPAGIDITLGIRLRSQARWSNNWRAAYGRSKQLRKRVASALESRDVDAVIQHLGGHVNDVRFVRLAPKTLDTDNLATVFKPIRDQVCCWLGRNNDPTARATDGIRSGYEFSYGQQQQSKTYGVRIELRRKP